MEPQAGQVWKDTINGDLLLVKEVDAKGTAKNPRYARCLAFCAPGTWEIRPGMRFMGMQEMQFNHFTGRPSMCEICEGSGGPKGEYRCATCGGTGVALFYRFELLGWIQTLYYRWRMKKWVKEGGM
jgi:hypothetical protein